MTARKKSGEPKEKPLYDRAQEIRGESERIPLAELNSGRERVLRMLKLKPPPGVFISEEQARSELTQQLKASCVETGWYPDGEVDVFKGTDGKWTIAAYLVPGGAKKPGGTSHMTKAAPGASDLLTSLSS